MYKEAEYANSRLAGTIVRTNNIPVTVNDCHYDDKRNVVANWTSLSGRKNGSSELSKMNLKPVPLGFANTRYGVAYLTRVPKRGDYRQGLRNSNYTSLTTVDHRRVNNTELQKTITGRFPSFGFALDIVSNSKTSHAFSRDFALQSVNRGSKLKVQLLFKWIGEVGDVIEQQPLLKEEFSYLQESLEEAMA